MSGARTAVPGRRLPSPGQALVEFALVLPVFLLLVLGLVDGGRLVFANNTVAQAAHEAARLALVQAPYIGASGSGCTAPTCPGTTVVFHGNVLGAANDMTAVVGTVPSADLTVLCTHGDPGTWSGGNDCSSNNASGAGNDVSVRITMPIGPLTPFFAPFYPSSITAAATMAIP